MFAPVILWNADHQWVSFIKQIGRARIEDFRPAFIGELIPTQIAFATPLVWILGAMGLYALLAAPSRRAGRADADQHHVLDHRRCISSGIRCTPASRPTGSRRSIRRSRSRPRSPPHLVRWEARWQRVVDFCLRWAAPIGIVMFALLVVQANTGVLSGYRRDATVRSVGVGWRELAAEIEAVRAARRRRLRAGAGLRHHQLACLLSAERHLRAAADAAHPLGQHARAGSGAARRQTAVCR